MIGLACLLDDRNTLILSIDVGLEFAWRSTTLTTTLSPMPYCGLSSVMEARGGDCEKACGVPNEVQVIRSTRRMTVMVLLVHRILDIGPLALQSSYIKVYYASKRL